VLDCTEIPNKDLLGMKLLIFTLPIADYKKHIKNFETSGDTADLVRKISECLNEDVLTWQNPNPSDTGFSEQRLTNIRRHFGIATRAKQRDFSKKSAPRYEGPKD